VSGLGHHLLVGGDDVFALADRAQNVIVRGFHPADEFGENVNFGVVDNVVRVGRDKRAVHHDRPFFVQRSHGDFLYRDGRAHAPRDLVRIFLQNTNGAGADHAQAQNADLDLAGGGLHRLRLAFLQQDERVAGLNKGAVQGRNRDDHAARFG